MVRWLDVTLPTAEENLAFDEAQSPGTLRFWESPRWCVVLGRSGSLPEEVDAAACERAGVPILRRGSGGGAVLLGPGCLNFTLVLALETHAELCDVRRSYELILGRAAEALEAERGGETDLVIADRKISGNAQRRTRDALLHHGTVLYDFDLAAISRFLRDPRRQPAYRRRRPHDEFVRNAALGSAQIAARLAAAWNAA